MSKIEFEQNWRYGYALSVGITTDTPLVSRFGEKQGGGGFTANPKSFWGLRLQTPIKLRTERRLRRAFFRKGFRTYFQNLK